MAEPTDYESFFTNVQDPVQAYYAGQQQAQARAATTAQQQFQAQQNQASLAAAQLKAQAIQTAIAQPTQANYRAAALTDPDHATGILGALSNLNDQQQKSEVGHAAAVDGYLQANQPDQAASLVQQRIVADQAAGLDTTDDQALYNLIKTDPATAKAHSGIMMASLDPKTFAPNVGAYDANQKQVALLPGEVAAQPGQAAFTAAQTAAATAAAAKSAADAQVELHPLPKSEAVSGAFNPDGSPVLFNPNAPPAANGAGVAQVPQGIQTLVPRLIASESGGNPNATNPNSSAAGAGQFLGGPNGTWSNLINQYRPDLAAGKTTAQIDALRSDPVLSAQMVANYAQQNAATLSASGQPVNGATLAMSHKLGVAGAQSVLAADPSAPLTKVLPANVIGANPQLAKLTAGQYAQGLAQQFGTDPIQAGPVDPTTTGDAFLATLPPGRARMIQAYANGDLAMPTGKSAMTGQAQILMQQVQQYDPTASAVNLPARLATRKAFTSGTQGQSITQANTVGGHLAALDGLSSNLDNGSIPLFNSIAQGVETATGNTAKQQAVTSFNTLRGTLAPELVKFYRSNGGSEADVQSFLKQLDSANSPTQIHAAIQGIAGAVLSKVGALNDSYNAGMGLTSQGLNLPNVNHNAIANLIKLAGPGAPDFGTGLANQPPPASPQVYSNAQGQRIVYDAASKSWKPVS